MGIPLNFMPPVNIGSGRASFVPTANNLAAGISKNVMSGAAPSTPSMAGIASAAPQLLNIVAGANLAQQIASGVQQPGLTPADLVDIERDLYLDPVYALRRHFRVYYCPGSSNGSTLSFAPQRDCIPFMLHVPSGSAGTTTISRMQNGVRQYFATADAVPSSMFTEKATGPAHYLSPKMAKVGNTITANTTLASGTVAALACFDMSGDVLSPPTGRPMQIGFSAGSIAAGASANATTSPQKVFRLRSIRLDSTVTNWDAQIDGTHGIHVTGVTVANDPQTEASGDLPGTLFDAQATAPMLDMDGDVCQVGAQIVQSFTNKEAANAIVVQGVLWGDSLGPDDFMP